jgi:hypothetical protein
MSTPPVRHPDDRVLVAFKMSKLDQRQIALVNKHVKECQACRHRLASLSAQLEMPAVLKADPVPAAQVAIASTATQANRNVRPATRPAASRRSPKLVWPAAVGVVILLALGIAWSVGAFNGQSNAKVAAVEKAEPPNQSSPPKVTDEPTALPSTQVPAMPSPTAAATIAPKTADIPRVVAEPRQTAPQVENSLASASRTVAATSARAASETDKPPADDASAPFFNGKDFAGWQGSQQIWHVQNGSIIGSLPAGQMQSSYLASRQKYKDFDLMFEATLAEGIGDCGVQFRSHASDVDKRQFAGPLCGIYGKDAPNGHRTGSLLIEPGGKIEKAPAAQRVERFVDPTANHFHIRCEGNHVLIEVNGIPMVYGDFPSLPEEGVVAWKINADRPPHKVTFKILQFTDLSRSPKRAGSERPSLLDVDLLTAEFKFEIAMKKADETLLNRFDSEATRLKRSAHRPDKDLVDVVEHEKELFKERGLIPWCRPMRKSLLQYGKELHDAQRAVGTAFDAAIERAEKSHNEKLKEALLAEAGQVLAPREVAVWQRTSKKGEVYRRIFYSDGTFSEGDQQAETTSRFWTPPIDDVLTLEFPDKEDSTSTNEQLFLLSSDGKTLTTKSKKDNVQVWKQAEEAHPNGESPDPPTGG